MCAGEVVPRTPKTAPTTGTCRVLRGVKAATNARAPWVPGSPGWRSPAGDLENNRPTWAPREPSPTPHRRLQSSRWDWVGRVPWVSSVTLQSRGPGSGTCIQNLPGQEGGWKYMERSRPIQESGCPLESLRVTLNPPQPTSANLITWKPQRKSIDGGRWGDSQKGIRAMQISTRRYDLIYIRWDAHIHQISRHQGWRS